MEETWALINNPATAEEGLRILRARVADQPSDPKLLFDLASAYDLLDREAEAEQAYRQVEHLGIDHLSPTDRARWYIQAGSTLRLHHEIAASQDLLARGEAEFPDNSALSAFRAITELAAGSPTSAARVLMHAVLRLRSTDIDFYRPALAHYADDLLGQA